jgi:cyanosortase A-associated protein
MNHKTWQKARLLVLSCCSLSIFLTLGIKLLANPTVDNYQFPENLALNEWESIDTSNIKYYDENLQGKRYQSEASNNFTVEVYYIPNNRRGNEGLISQYRKLESVPENITIIENKQLGHYGLFTKNNQVNLNTCIHSQGKTAFTAQQFDNLVNQNLKSRLLPWILGVSDLRTWDCFWVNMSVPLTHITEEEAYIILQIELATLVAKII